VEIIPLFELTFIYQNDSLVPPNIAENQ